MGYYIYVSQKIRVHNLEMQNGCLLSKWLFKLINKHGVNKHGVWQDLGCIRSTPKLRNFLRTQNEKVY